MKTLRIALPFLCIAGGLSLLFFSSFFTQTLVPSESQATPQLEENVLGTSEGIQEETTIPVVLSLQEKRYEFQVSQGSTVYEAMVLLRETSGLKFGGRDFGGLGFFVEEINGVSQDPSRQMYWIYSINGKKSQVGVSSYTIQPGDVISWTYEHEE